MAFVQVNSELLQEMMEEIRYLRADVRALHDRLGDRLFTCDEAAYEWNRSKRTISRWIAQGRVHPVNSEGHPLFSLDEINRVKREL